MSLISRIAGREFGRGRRRSRRQRAARPSTAADVLEARVLLSATTISPLENVSLKSDTDVKTVSLNSHFDDPAIEGSTVRIETPLGSFIIETYDRVTPLTAANFVSLAGGGNYTDMFIHRSDPGFVIQGGGYTMSQTEQVGNVANNGNVVNEFDNWFDPELGGLEPGTPLNVRGTVAMAKQAGDPNSANSQWFVSLGDNSSILDPQNGGFTVFGHVLFDGMQTADAIAALQIVNAGSPFNELPVRNYESGSILRQHLVTTTTTVVDELTFQVTGNTNPDVVSAVVIDGQLQITGVPGQSGTATITVTATDLDGQTAASSMDVVVPLSASVTAPAGSSSDLRPTFTWTSAVQATKYELWVNRIGGPSAIIHETNISGTSFTTTEDLPFGEYRVWVRPGNEAGNGIWSDPQAFSLILAPVTVTAPSTYNVTVRRPVIEWTASENAASYDLWVSRIGSGAGQVIREPSLTGTSFTPTQDLSDGIYRVWVQAKSGAVTSVWSTGLTFEIAITKAPTITGPEGISTTPRPQFTWTGDASATYELWVNQIGGAARVIHETAITGTSFTPSTDLVNAPYKAWARKRPATGDPGTWSEPFQFTVGVPPGSTQISDVTGTNTARPTFIWSAAAGAVRYELWVNDLTRNVVRVIHETSITALQHTAGSDLATGQYRAWVRAVAGGNVAGTWSSAFNFTLV
ncbi:MAG: peptidylprolyl isomerase [Planctomycetaceae bacterium]